MDEEDALAAAVEERNGTEESGSSVDDNE